MLTFFDGSRPLVHAQLFGGIEGDELEGLLLAHATVLHGLGGFQVEATGMIGGVGVEAHGDAAFMHDGSGIGYGVVDLELIGPPIGEGRSTGSVSSDFVRYLVSFQYMLKGSDFHSERFHQSEKDKDLVLSVGVTMNEALALYDFANGIQLQITAYGRSFALLGQFSFG